MADSSEESIVGTLTGIHAGKLIVRVGGEKRELYVSEKLGQEIIEQDLIPSPVKVTVEGMKTVSIVRRQLDL